MQLNFLFKDGHQRVINVSPEFFTTVDQLDFRTKKFKPYTAANKARDIAYDLGASPYKISLVNGTGEVMSDTNQANRPHQDNSWRKSPQTKQERKAIRNAHKGDFNYTLFSLRLLSKLNLQLEAA